MIDSYKFPQLLRSVASLRAAFILGFVLLFAVPASGQTRIYQFTGPASVEINNVAQAGTPSTRIELQVTAAVGEYGAAGLIFEEKFANVSSGTIFVDGVPYPLDTSTLSVRRPNNDYASDRSSYFTNNTIPFARGAPLTYPGIAIHHSETFITGQFYHYFKGKAASANDPLTLPNTTLESVAPLTIEIDFVATNSIYSEFVSGGGGVDYGDAPDSGIGTGANNYNTLATDAGPSHFLGGPTLGALADRPGAEGGTLQDADATADDLDVSDDEDGVTFPLSIISSVGVINTSSYVVDVQGAGGPYKVSAWFDFDQDGSFEIGEKVTDDLLLAVGIHVVPFSIPAGAATGTTFARFRISTGGTALPIGAAADGEVEDHKITILDGSVASPVGVDLSPTTGGAGAQPITIAQDVTGNSTVTLGAGPPTMVFSAPLPAVGPLTVVGTAAPDNFIIDHTNGNVATGPVTIDGGGLGDDLTIRGGAPGDMDTIHHTHATLDSGSIAYIAGAQPAHQTVNYTSVETVIDELQPLHRIYTFNGADNIVQLIDGPVASLISTTPATSALTTFTNPTTDLVINGGVGADTFDIQPSKFYPVSVNGDAPTTFVGGDTFNLDAGSLGAAVITLNEASDNAGT